MADLCLETSLPAAGPSGEKRTVDAIWFAVRFTHFA